MSILLYTTSSLRYDEDHVLSKCFLRELYIGCKYNKTPLLYQLLTVTCNMRYSVAEWCIQAGWNRGFSSVPAGAGVFLFSIFILGGFYENQIKK